MLQCIFKYLYLKTKIGSILFIIVIPLVPLTVSFISALVLHIVKNSSREQVINQIVLYKTSTVHENFPKNTKINHYINHHISF